MVATEALKRSSAEVIVDQLAILQFVARNVVQHAADLDVLEAIVDAAGVAMEARAVLLAEKGQIAAADIVSAVSSVATSRARLAVYAQRDSLAEVQ